MTTTDASIDEVKPKSSSPRLRRWILISMVLMAIAVPALIAWQAWEQYRVIEQFKASRSHFLIAPVDPKWEWLGLDEKSQIWQAICPIYFVQFSCETLPLAEKHPAVFSNVTSASFVRVPLDDAALSRLFDSAPLSGAGATGRANGIFRNVRDLGLYEVALNDERLRFFSGMHDLESLSLLGGDVTDAGLTQIAGLSKLQTLSLRRVPIDGSFLSKISATTPLKSIDFEVTQFGDPAMVEVAKFTMLRQLYLRDTKVTDSGLAHLIALPNLRKIDLDGTAITDAGLDHLTKLLSLEEIDLSSTNITDAGMMKVATLPRLHNVKALHTKVTEAGAEAFHHYRRLRSMDCVLDL